MFDGVIKLERDIAAFATNLADALIDVVNLLPRPCDLIDALDIGSLINSGDALCLAPSCPGFHINSGKEENLVPGVTDAISILASLAHAYRIPRRNVLESQAHVFLDTAHRPHTTLVHCSVWSNVAGAHLDVGLLQDIRCCARYQRLV